MKFAYYFFLSGEFILNEMRNFEEYKPDFQQNKNKTSDIIYDSLIKINFYEEAFRFAKK